MIIVNDSTLQNKMSYVNLDFHQVTVSITTMNNSDLFKKQIKEHLINSINFSLFLPPNLIETIISQKSVYCKKQ